MTLISKSRAAVAGGAVSALALGGALVGMAPAANAAPVTVKNTYTCPTSFGTYSATVESTVPVLDQAATYPAGFTVPDGFVEMKNRVTVKQDLYNLIQTTDSATIIGYKVAVGTDNAIEAKDSALPAKGQSAAWTANPDGTYSADVNSSNHGAYSTPAAGTHAVSTPATFTINAVLGTLTVPVTCTNAAPVAGDLGNLVTTKNDAVVKAKKVSVKKTAKVAKIKVAVKASNHPATGKLVAKIGKKKVGTATVKAGKATVKVKAKFLKAGKNKVKLAYGGDAYTNKAKGTAVVTVK